MIRAMLFIPICLISLFSSAAQTPSVRIERLSVGGVDYVKLDDWSRASRFQLKWLVAKQSIQLTAGENNLGFTSDSRKATFNGVTVWLSAPTVFRNNSLYVSSTDVTTVLFPLLAPAKASARRVGTICLDPGHGGKDPGKQSGKQQEKTYTLLLAKELSSQLTRAGFKVTLTRSTDEFVDLSNRPEKARKNSADLFISLHFNADNTSSLKGSQIYCMTPARTSSTNAGGEGANTGAFVGNKSDSRNIMLGYQVQRSLLKSLGLEDGGVRRARFAVLRSAEMPAILIEGGFMTNPAEAKKIYDVNYRKQLAQAIVTGILNYKKAVES